MHLKAKDVLGCFFCQRRCYSGRADTNTSVKRQEPYQLVRTCIPILGCIKVGLCSSLAGRKKNHQQLVYLLIYHPVNRYYSSIVQHGSRFTSRTSWALRNRSPSKPIQIGFTLTAGREGKSQNGNTWNYKRFYMVQVAPPFPTTSSSKNQFKSVLRESMSSSHPCRYQKLRFLSYCPRLTYHREWQTKIPHGDVSVFNVISPSRETVRSHK